ncbi:ribonuclease HII [Ascidiimonas aurantiaca]|uniref:ribonuclease HII n=1 Tax=Ascidiimonas aurantiaca TaxID=1685432 RepID=UPI0030ECFFFC
MTLLSNFSERKGLEAGTDEAGRGCLAGPVTAAVVILRSSFICNDLNDSKQLTATRRDLIKTLIEQEAFSFAVSHVSPLEIDEMNILNASIEAMHRSLGKLSAKPGFIIVDGNRFKPFEKIPYECIIKGDAKYMSIAAASVLAKTYRDAYMAKIHEEYPMYNWIQNKGYPTREHREAIRKYGITEYHRKSFRLLPEQLKLAL